MMIVIIIHLDITRREHICLNQISYLTSLLKWCVNPIPEFRVSYDCED